jgi:succinate dehydrogenase hydrophobic anchor subunit
MQPRITPQRSLTLDYLMWLFTRITGLAIIFLALTGLGMGMILGARLQMDMVALLRWTFFPNYNHVINSNVPDVTLGWVSAFWQVMQMLVVFFAGTHAANGLRMIAEDYLGRRIPRNILRGFFLLLWVAFLILAFSVIIGSAY